MGSVDRVHDGRCGRRADRRLRAADRRVGQVRPGRRRSTSLGTGPSGYRCCTRCRRADGRRCRAVVHVGCREGDELVVARRGRQRASWRRSLVAPGDHGRRSARRSAPQGAAGADRAERGDRHRWRRRRRDPRPRPDLPIALTLSCLLVAVLTAYLLTAGLGLFASMLPGKTADPDDAANVSHREQVFELSQTPPPRTS